MVTKAPEFWSIMRSGEYWKATWVTVRIRIALALCLMAAGAGVTHAQADDLAAGFFHTAHILPNGTVVAWGYNFDGEVGDGTTTSPRTVPMLVKRANGNYLANITSVAAGSYHTLALDTSGQIWSWGQNGYGQLGNGGTGSQAFPVLVQTSSGVNLTNVIAIAAGGTHSMAVTADGTVWTWGDNSYGELGKNSTDSTAHSYAAQALGPSGSGTLGSITAVACGYYHDLALTSSGTVYSWGRDDYGQCGNSTVGYTTSVTLPIQVSSLTSVTAIAAGIYHSAALTSANVMFTWGYNYYGGLGNGTTNTTSPYGSDFPVQVLTTATTPLSNVTAIAAKGYHTLAISNGVAYAWGYNGYGQLGNGTTSIVAFAAPVTGLSGSGTLSGVVGIKSGLYGSFFELGGTQIAATGNNQYGQIGNGLTMPMSPNGYLTPILTGSFGPMVMVVAGDYNSAGLKQDGTVWTWGSNSLGQAGTGINVGGTNTTPVQVTGVSDVVQISGGGYWGDNVLALERNGTVWAWGRDDYGQCGNGTTIPTTTGGVTTPTQVIEPTDSTGFLTGVQSIAAGDYFSVALKSGGSVWAWGINANGELGQNALSATQSVAVQVKDSTGTTTLSGITAIAAGEYHTLALTNSGTIYAWGYNLYQELGNTAATTSQSLPIQVSGITTATAVACGSFHSMALLANRTVMAWGNNSYCQVGQPTSVANQATPILVAGISNVTQIAGGDYHSLAIKADGTAWAWGEDNAGQLGNGTSETDAQTPVQMIGPTNVVQIDGGYEFSLCVTTDGLVYGWGQDEFNEMGDSGFTGGQTSTAVPTTPTWVPVVSVAAGANAAEPSTVGTFIISRTLDVGYPQVVTYTMSGTAVGGTAAIPYDYIALSGTVTIPSGAASVTVNVVPFHDFIDKGTRTITMTLATPNGCGYTSTSPGNAATINETDCDVAAVTVTPTSGLVTTSTGTTATTASFTVSLATIPQNGSSVVIPVSSSNTAIGVIKSINGVAYSSQQSLTFTTYNQTQTVVVQAVSSYVAQGSLPFTVVLGQCQDAQDPIYAAITPSSVGCVNNNLNTLGIDVNASVSLTPLTIVDNGALTPVQVTLNSQPTSNVTVTLSPSAGLSTSVTTITFTNAANDWNTPRTVQVSAPNNFTYEPSGLSGTISLTASGGGYSGVSNSIPVQVTNNPSNTPALDISPVTSAGSPLVTTEAAGSQHTATFTVALNTIPSGNVTVALAVGASTPGNRTVATISPATLTFQPGTWNTTQTVTVTGIEDHIADGNQTYTISATPSSSDTYYNYNVLGASSIFGKSINDNTPAIDALPASVSFVNAVSPTPTTFTVALNSKPLANVSVTVSVGLSSPTGLTCANVSPTPLAFTPANYATAQTVTVTGISHASGLPDQTFTITLAASSSDTIYNGLTTPVSAVDKSNGTAGILTAPTSVTVTKASAPPSPALHTAPVNVTLSEQPASGTSVTMSVTSSDSTIAVVDQSQLTFTSATWNTPQTVNVTGIEDNIATGPSTTTITFQVTASTDAEYGSVLPMTTVNVNRVDDDVAAVLVSATAITTSESGAAGSFAVSLSSQPSAPVTVQIPTPPNLPGTSTPTGAVSPSTLTFTASNWRTPQTVTVTGATSFVDFGNILYSLVLTASQMTGTLQEYAGLTNSVAVTYLDTAVSGVTVTPISATLPLSPTALATQIPTTPTATFSVQLTCQPLGTDSVVIALSSTNTSQGTITTPASHSLTFTPANWNVPQNVVVTAVPDLVDDGNITYAITLEPAVSLDPSYSGLTSPSVPITSIQPTAGSGDHLIAGVTVKNGSGTTLTGGTPQVIAENALAANHALSFSYTLNSQPLDPVTIVVASSNTNDGTVSPLLLTFGSSDWNLPHTVTVTAVDDHIADGTKTFTLTASAVSGDPNYNLGTLGIVQVPLSETNDNVAGITMNPATIATTDSGPNQNQLLSVNLNTLPSGPVTVTLTPSGSAVGVGTLSATTLQFTPANWFLAQTVVVSGVPVSTHSSTPLTWTVTASSVGGTGPGNGSEYTGITPTVTTVNETDINVPGFTVTPSGGLVTSESGTSASFTIALNTQPSGTNVVTISFASSNPVKGTVTAPASGTLTFNASNWSTPQTVTVTGLAQNPPVADGNVPYSITGAVQSGSDPTYVGVNAPPVPSVGVTSTSIYTAGIIFTLVSPLAETTESSAPGEQHTATYNVTLATSPTAPVTISLTSSNTGKGTVTTSSMLTFDDTNWNQAQAVTVTGVDSHTQAGNLVYDLQGQVSATLDPFYTGVAAQTPITSIGLLLPVVYVAPSGLQGVLRGGSAVITYYDPVNDPAGLIGTTDAQTLPPAGGLVYTMKLVPSQGTLFRFEATDPVGGHPLAIGDTFPQSDLINGLIEYTHNGGIGATDGFAFTVTDSDGGVSALAVLPITIDLGFAVVTLNPGPVTWTDAVPLMDPVIIDASATIFDPAAQAGSFLGGNLTVTLSGGTALDIPHDVIGIRNQGTDVGQIGVNGASVTYGTPTGIETIGSISSDGIGGPLVITCTSLAQNVEMTALIENITFSNDTFYPSANPRTMTFVMTDSSGGNPSQPVSATIDVVPVNLPPTLSAPTLVTAPGAPINGAVIGNDPNLPLDTLTYSVPLRNAPGGPTKGIVVLDTATGSFLYTPDGTSIGQEQFTVTVTDSGGLTAQATVTVIISDPNTLHPWVTSRPPMETDASTVSYLVQVDVSAFAQTPTPSQLSYTLIGNLGQITTYSFVAESATSATLNFTHTATLGQYLSFTIVVTDSTNNAAGSQPITIKIVNPSGGG